MWKFYIIMITSLAVVSAAFPFWSGTVQDQIISYDDNLLGWYTRSVVDGDGTIHVVWNEKIISYPSLYEIHYSRSSDNGRTWSAIGGDIVISFDDSISAENGSSIAVDSDNNLYVVWAEEDLGVDEIHYSISTDGGDSWSGQTADHILSYPGGTNANNPAMVIDQNDVIHVVWNQVWQGATTEIYYSRSTDGGATWSSQTAESIISYPDGAPASYPDIAIGPDNEICVVFREDHELVTTHDVINATISTDGGLTWTGSTADRPTTQAIRIANYPHVEIDPDGNIHVTFQGTQNEVSPFHYEVFYSRSTDGGTMWTGLTADQIISYYEPGGASASNPNFGMDDCGNLFAVWDEDYITADNEIHISMSTDGGNTWSGENQDEIISFPDGHPAYRPFITAGIDDTLHVTWNEGVINNYYQITYSRGDAVCISAGPAIDDLTITMDGSNAILNWDDIPQAVGFKIYRSDDPRFTPSPPDSIGYTTTNTFTDPNIAADNATKFYNVIVVY